MTKTEQRQLQALYVTWQNSLTKQYFPVGRLVSGLAPDKPEYEFCYLNGADAAEKAGFEPLLSFSSLNRIYRSDELFPLFQNRLMSPGRVEYREYLSNLGLDPATVDPMTVLVRSGGVRATDSLEIFEVPRVSDVGLPFQTHFLAHGLRYLHSTSLMRIGALQPNDRLRIMHDFQNAHDAGALALSTEDRIIVGYMPRYLLGDAFKLLTSCITVECFVSRVNPVPAPLQQRLLCRLEACWTPGFRPFCDREYEPICPEAVDLSAWCGGDSDV